MARLITFQRTVHFSEGYAGRGWGWEFGIWAFYPSDASEVRDWKLGLVFGGWRLEVGRLEVGDWRLGVGGRGLEVGVS